MTQFYLWILSIVHIPTNGASRLLGFWNGPTEGKKNFLGGRTIKGGHEKSSKTGNSSDIAHNYLDPKLVFWALKLRYACTTVLGPDNPVRSLKTSQKTGLKLHAHSLTHFAMDGGRGKQGGRLHSWDVFCSQHFLGGELTGPRKKIFGAMVVGKTNFALH